MISGAGVLAVTGHRPHKLGGYDGYLFAQLVNFATAILMESQPKKIITGMALGWDIALAEAALGLHIPYIAAVPFEGQEARWRVLDVLRYQRLMKAAAECVVVTPGAYARWKFQDRNEWMVNHSNEVLALWDGSDGGTANCVGYAQKQGRLVMNVWLAWAQYQTSHDLSVRPIPRL